MKNTRTVIVLQNQENEFAFATDFKTTLDFSTNIKNADEFESVQAANVRLEAIKKMGFESMIKGISVKKYSYEIDVKFLGHPESIAEL